MKILAIDTSSKIASVAIIEENTVLKEIHDTTEKEHSQTLMPMIKEVLETLKIKIDDIGVIAINIGPGSFTGIRIGIATAKALSDVKNIPIISVNALETIAYKAVETKALKSIEHNKATNKIVNNENCKILSMIDARNDNVYCAVYRMKENNLFLYKNPETMHISNVIEYVNFYEKLYIIGDISKDRIEPIIQAKLSKEIAQARDVNGKYEFVENEECLAKYVGICAKNRYEQGTYNNNCNPMYLRKPQAERNRIGNDDKIYLLEIMAKDAEEIERNYDKFPNLWSLEQFKQDKKDSKILVAKQSNEIIGFVSFKHILDEVEIMNIVTRKDKRNQGIASNLLSYIIRKEKANKINLEVNENNITAINLYSRFGFKKVGLRKKYYDGKEDAILMTL